mmetsp:Transcript_23107/g.54619  ORF Transcript_23107/g.54619 Transcript_23107/m.54619 type:complete len:180 (-) Transcript_23107:448-987(-)
MHFANGFVPLHLYYQFYGSLLLVGILGSCALSCLALMIYYGTEGIELVSILCIIGLFGLERLLIWPWSTMADEEGTFFSMDSNPNSHFRSRKRLADLEVETKILGTRNENDDSVFVHRDFRNSNCSICLQSFEIGEHIAVACRCKHTFHSVCLQQWIQKSYTCPYCRQDLEKSLPKRKN